MDSTRPCPRCQETLYPDDRFCAGCGARVEAEPTLGGAQTRVTAAAGRSAFPCEGCGDLVLPGDRFCAGCGAKQLSEASKRLKHAPRARTGWEEIESRLRDATLGEYEILGELGRGGMAAVYLAHEIALNRRVAIKVMSPGYLLDPGMVDRFRREAITAARLRHRNIVTIHAVRNTELLHYFVMEYVEGRALDHILRDHGALPIPVALAVLFQVGNAVAYAHRQGVIHRDLKPANIMISSEGDAIVTDFGIAKAGEVSSTFQTAGPIGTPLYMSPEQCHAHQLTAASDQYSLGVVLFEMLTGRPPFSGSALAIQIAHTTTAPPSVRNERPDVPAGLADALGRMLEKRPEDRWPDVTQAIAACGARPLGPEDALQGDLSRLADRADSAPRPVIRTPVSPRPSAAPVSDPALRTVAAVQIQPLDAPLRPGDTASLRVRVAARTGETLAGRVVTWSSSQPTIATVGADGVLRAIESGSVTISARCEGVTGSLELAVLTPLPAKIALEPIGEPLEVGSRRTARARVLDRRGLPIDGLAIAWSSTPRGVLAISEEGEMMAVSAGRATVLAACEGVEAKAEVVVAPPPVDTVAIIQPPDVITVGATVQLTVRVADRQGRPLSGRVVTWNSEPPNVAAISPNGLLTARAPGQVRITASCEGRTAIRVIDVGAPQVARIVIAPHERAIREGERARLKAVAFDARNQELGKARLEWWTSNASVATVDLAGAVVAHAAGTVTVTVACDGVVESTVLEIVAMPAAMPLAAEPGTREEPSVQRSPAEEPPAEPPPPDRRKLLIGAGAFAVVALVAWLALRGPGEGATPTTSQSAAAGDSGQAPSTPPATAGAVSPESTTTSAATGPGARSDQPRLQISAPRGEILPGDTIVVLARVTDGGRARPAEVAWSSDRPELMSPDRAGRAVVRGTGAVTLTARSPAVPEPARIRIVIGQARVESVTIGSAPDTLVVGARTTATASAADQRGRSVPVRWRSTAPEVVAIDDRGGITAIQTGSTALIAEAGDRSARHPIRVVAPRGTSVAAATTPVPAPAPAPAPAAVPPAPAPDSSGRASATGAIERAGAELVTWFARRDKRSVGRLYRPQAGGPTAKALEGFLDDVEGAALDGTPSPSGDAGGQVRIRIRYRDMDGRRGEVSLLASVALAGSAIESFSLAGRLP